MIFRCLGGTRYSHVGSSMPEIPGFNSCFRVLKPSSEPKIVAHSDGQYPVTTPRSFPNAMIFVRCAKLRRSF